MCYTVELCTLGAEKTLNTSIELQPLLYTRFTMTSKLQGFGIGPCLYLIYALCRHKVSIKCADDKR